MSDNYQIKGVTAVVNGFFGFYDIIPIDGGLYLPPDLTENYWTGAIDEDWDNPGNWSFSVVPGAGDDVIIDDVGGSKAPFPTIYGSAATGFLTIMPLAQLNIAPMADLTTFGPLLNNGTFVVESSGIVNFGQGEAGSYIDMAGLGGTGVFEFQRDITNITSFGDQNGWHLISSPLPGGEFTSNDLFYYYLNWYDNATQLYVHHAGSPTIPCTPAPMLANGLMEGWSIKYDNVYGPLCMGGVEDEVINMMGTAFNTGAQSAGFGVAWDLLGNPYPSAIDVDVIGWPAGLTTNTVYMWDGWIGSWVLGFAGNPNNFDIPVGQGFFVEGSTGGTFGLTGGERIHDNFQWWWKDASEILALKATVEGLPNSDITYIRFNDESTIGLDKEWDANKLFAGVDETPEIYTTTGGLELALNTQPEMQSVPMSFICKTAGTYTIEAIETGTFDHVVLENGLTGEQTDLLEGPYTFDYSSINEVHPFIVHFSPLGIGDNNAENVSIWSSDNNIYVQAPTSLNGDIVVYNMMGQEEIRTDIAPGVNTIPMDNINTYYVVKVLSDNNVVTGKVYIK
ncbi:MAG: T9SS type A sorting domain-containing protein [Bacteroidales bacterium]|nr:T9SS type A sorting domain-containing protein [Bacteroidales bacterium]